MTLLLTELKKGLGGILPNGTFPGGIFTVTVSFKFYIGGLVINSLTVRSHFASPLERNIHWVNILAHRWGKGRIFRPNTPL